MTAKLLPFADTLPFLRQVPAFALLEDAELEQLGDGLQAVHFGIGQVICRAGDPGDAFFLVYSGRARVITGSTDGEITVGTLSRGDHFGERALLTGDARAFTVRAADDLVLLRLSQDEFQRVIARRPELRQYFERYVADLATRNFVRLCSTFRPLRPAEIQAVLDQLEPQEFTAGATVFHQGDPGDRFYLIRSGRARVLQDGREIARRQEGEFFGERALLTGERRTATIVAETPLSTLTFSSANLAQLLQQFPRLRESIETIALSRQQPLPPSDREPALREPAPPPDRAWEAPPWEALRHPERALARHRRRPLVLQISENDCGAACLAMIGRFFGREYRLQTLRELSEVGREGASLRGLADAAEKLGFRARPIRAEFQHLAQTSLPVIAHWAGNHFVVVYEIRRRTVLVADPALGLRRLPEAEFRRGWTGMALVVEPGDQLSPSEAAPGLLGRFLPLVRPYWPVLLEVLACSLVLQVLGLATPLFTQVIVDRVLVYRDVSLLNLMLAGMVLVVLFQLVTAALRQYLLVYTTRRIDVSVAVQFLGHVLRLPTRYFENNRVGDIVTRFGETENVRRLLTSTATTVLLDALTIVVYVAVLFVYNPSLTLIVLWTFPAFALLSLAMTSPLRANFRAAFEAHAAVQSHLVELISGVQSVKSARAERPVRWKWEELLLKYLRLQFQGMNYRLVLDSLGTILHVSITTALLWYGARLVMSGQLTVGQLMAFFALTGSLLAAILRMVSVWDELQDVRISLERLSDVFDSDPEEPSAPAPRPSLPRVSGHLRFEKVTFRYSDQARSNAVENIDLEILPGQMVALIGRSGSGKSTLVGLTLRLYEPTSGRITVDGHDISKVALASWRSQVAAVLQESFLFSGTLRDNIALGHPEASFDDVRRAAVLAGADDFISELPLGYNTLVGERGSSLSGGQRQRVAIARALLADPRILILDEATSALDTESERAIQRNLDTVLRDRTTLVIAHRLSTVRHADLIVLLDRGVIVERGTHEELMARQGLYFYLCSQQLEQ